MKIVLTAVIFYLTVLNSTSIDAQMRSGEVTWSTNAGLVIPNSANDSETLFGYGINVGVDKIISDADWSIGLSIAYYNVGDRFYSEEDDATLETDTDIYPMYLTIKKHFGKSIWVPYIGAGIGYQFSQVKSDLIKDGYTKYLLDREFSSVSAMAILGIYYFFTPDWLLNASFTPIWLFDTPVGNVYNSLFNLGVGFQID